MRWSHCLFSESSLCSKIMLKGNKGRGDPGEVAVAEETRMMAEQFLAVQAVQVVAERGKVQMEHLLLAQ